MTRLLFDSHLDLAWNTASFDRDLTLTLEQMCDEERFDDRQAYFVATRPSRFLNCEERESPSASQPCCPAAALNMFANRHTIVAT